MRTAIDQAKQEIKDILLSSELSSKEIDLIPERCQKLLSSLPIKAGTVFLPSLEYDSSIDKVMSKVLDVCQLRCLSVDAALHLISSVVNTLTTEVVMARAESRPIRDSTDFFSDLLAECSVGKGST